MGDLTKEHKAERDFLYGRTDVDPLTGKTKEELQEAYTKANAKREEEQLARIAEAKEARLLRNAEKLEEYGKTKLGKNKAVEPKSNLEKITDALGEPKPVKDVTSPVKKQETEGNGKDKTV